MYIACILYVYWFSLVYRSFIKLCYCHGWRYSSIFSPNSTVVGIPPGPRNLNQRDRSTTASGSGKSNVHPNIKYVSWNYVRNKIFCRYIKYPHKLKKVYKREVEPELTRTSMDINFSTVVVCSLLAF